MRRSFIYSSAVSLPIFIRPAWGPGSAAGPFQARRLGVTVASSYRPLFSVSFFLTFVEKRASCLLLVTHYPPAEAPEGHPLYATLRGSQGTEMNETLLIPVFSSVPPDPRFPSK